MSVSGLPTARERLVGVEIERRRMVVRYVALAFGMLTALAAAYVAILGAPLATGIVDVLAVLGYAATFWLARRPLGIRLQAGVLLGNTQLLAAGAALTVSDPSEIGACLMFQGLTPLIAAAAMRTRGTVFTMTSAVASIVIVFVVQLAWGQAPATLMRFIGSSVFFVIVAGVVGILAATAAKRSLNEQVEREESAARDRAAAAAAEQRLHVMADQVSDLVSVHDEQGRFTFASASYRHTLDIEPASLIGRARADLLHPDDAASVHSAFQAALQNQARELVSRIVTKAGATRTFHLRMVRADLDGRAHVVVAMRDITELQQLTAEIESGRRMDALGRLASGVAHDFNNLLSVVRSCAGVIRKQLPADHVSRRDLLTIDDAVAQAAALTGQLLSFARSQVLPTGRTTPSAAIAQLAPLLRRAIGSEVKLEIEPSFSSWETQLGAGQVEQILMNLAMNARDAMPHGGRLRLRVSDCPLAAEQVPNLPAGDYVLIEVRDTGVGMSREVQAHIFEPFFTTKSARGGTGLGLATSFGLARQVGGTLTVESRSGEGSTFRLYLPRAGADTSHETRHEHAPSSDAHAESQNILVIDDNERIAETTARLLETYGHRAVTAGSAQDALAQAKTGRFDTIMTDVVLGCDDGLDILAQLRALQPDARAIVMSGFTPSPERLDVLRQTGIVFLPKPFSSAALQAACTTRVSLRSPRSTDDSMLVD